MKVTMQAMRAAAAAPWRNAAAARDGRFRLRRSFRRIALACAALGSIALAGCDQTSSRGANGRRAHELAGRLLAPCCWIQTLDVHESELATSLRDEIDQRLRRGEVGGAMEDDLAARYGERIRAVPRGEDPRRAAPIFVGLAMGMTLAGLLWLGRSWKRRARAAPASAEAAQPHDEYDTKLEEELARCDGP